MANNSAVTHQTPRQQGGTGEDGHIHLADWTLSVAAIEKKKKKKKKKEEEEEEEEEEEKHALGRACMAIIIASPRSEDASW